MKFLKTIFAFGIYETWPPILRVEHVTDVRKQNVALGSTLGRIYGYSHARICQTLAFNSLTFYNAGIYSFRYSEQST
jgi:hypothetical protein